MKYKCPKCNKEVDTFFNSCIIEMYCPTCKKMLLYDDNDVISKLKEINKTWHR